MQGSTNNYENQQYMQSSADNYAPLIHAGKHKSLRVNDVCRVEQITMNQ